MNNYTRVLSDTYVTLQYIQLKVFRPRVRSARHVRSFKDKITFSYVCFLSSSISSCIYNLTLSINKCELISGSMLLLFPKCFLAAQTPRPPPAPRPPRPPRRPLLIWRSLGRRRGGSEQRSGGWRSREE